MKIHIVQKGDTLWNIAKKYGVNFEELKKMNAQLSNPEMIMPGMKIKVPTSGGSIKKEVAIPKKEMPKAVHPYKEQPVPTMPVQKEIIKEVPKKETIYTPIMPQPVIPEIDINNYYTMNMSQMQAQMQAPPPAPPIKEESIELPMEMPMMPVQEECFEVYPTVPCMPIADCGCGPGQFPYGHQVPMGHFPMQQGFPMGYPTTVMPEMQGAPMGYAPETHYYSQGAYPTQVPEYGGWMHEEESSSSIPMMTSHSMPQHGGNIQMQSQDVHIQGMNSMPNLHQGSYLPAHDGGMSFNPFGQFGNMPQQGVNMNFPEMRPDPYQHYGMHDHSGSHHHHQDYHQGHHSGSHYHNQDYHQGHHYGQSPYGQYGHYGYHPYSQFYGAPQGWNPGFGYGNPYMMGYGQGYPGYPGGYFGGYPRQEEDCDDC